jgi:hypothetical protein
MPKVWYQYKDKGLHSGTLEAFHRISGGIAKEAFSNEEALNISGNEN